MERVEGKENQPCEAKRRPAVAKLTSSASTKKRKRRALSKATKQRVTVVLKKAYTSTDQQTRPQNDAGSELFASVLQDVDGQLHIYTYPCRADFWEKFKINDLMAKICEGLAELYSRIYMQCDKGKEKHSKFQLEWYEKCSFMLRDDLTKDVAHPLFTLSYNWLLFRNQNVNSSSASVYHCNAVLIAVQSAVYNYLIKVTASAVSDMLCTAKMTHSSDTVGSSDVVNTTEEPEDVYYRFCGAAIAVMLHNRYKRLHCCPMDKRSSVISEINIIKAIQTTDKAHVPPSLLYRDRGFMYFPDSCFLPFIRSVDQKVKAIANEQGIRQHGKNIIDVATKAVKGDYQLKSIFTDALSSKFDCLDGLESAIGAVYDEMLRKLCNTRLSEFMDSFRQMQVSKSGTATLCGQNLRDTLLSEHVNMKSQFNEVTIQ